MTDAIIFEKGSADRVFRLYPNGQVKDETHVLWPHYVPDEGQKTGYDGNVSAWSEHNQKWRFGCAQIMLRGGEWSILYRGNVDDETFAEFFEARRPVAAA